MHMTPPPFARFEWMIAWRYLRAKRVEGGVSVMTWISLIGIILAVFALIATLAVRAGFRAEFVDTILGANAHVSIYTSRYVDSQGQITRGFSNAVQVADNLRAVAGVLRAAPVIKDQAMVTANGRNLGAQVFGMSQENLASLPRIGQGADAKGDLAQFASGIAIGQGIAQELGLLVGDKLRLIAPDGVKTAFGTSPRVKSYPVVYIFSAGRYDIDHTRVYLPFTEAQSFFNREGIADEIEVMVSLPDQIDQYADALQAAAGGDVLLWTWKDGASSFLRALKMEDNVMFIILSILVLIATMNIVSGLIMLVKNKGRDIGILRTMGLSEGAVMRIFFICGAATGLIGTVLGVLLGCFFALYIDPIFALVDYLSGGEAWDASVRGIYALPAKLLWRDVASAVGLSLGLSFVVTLFPARRAARLNPVEALRYE